MEHKHIFSQWKWQVTWLTSRFGFDKDEQLAHSHGSNGTLSDSMIGLNIQWLNAKTVFRLNHEQCLDCSNACPMHLEQNRYSKKHQYHKPKKKSQNAHTCMSLMLYFTSWWTHVYVRGKHITGGLCFTTRYSQPELTPPELTGPQMRASVGWYIAPCYQRRHTVYPEYTERANSMSGRMGVGNLQR